MSFIAKLSRFWSTRKPPRHSKIRPQRRLRLENLERRELLAGIVMTNHEQLILELVNRARANPTAEAARFGIDLNQGLAAGTISTTPKEPLAPNQSLINAARLHSQDMLDRDFFSHTNLSGQTASQRMTAAGYSGQSTGENIAWGGQSPTAVDPTAHAFERHESLFRSAGHRRNILRETFDELGVGYRTGVFTSGGTNWNASMVTENFGGSWSSQFITGVAYTDTVTADNFYTVGEGIGNLTVRATSSTGASYETVTGASGGYVLDVPNGTYSVTFSGAGFTGQVQTSNVVVSGSNQKIDLNARTAVWSSPTTRMDVAGLLAGAWTVEVADGTRLNGSAWGTWAVNAQNILAGDVNGDGLDDVIVRDSSGSWRVAISSGSGFNQQTWGFWSNAGLWEDIQVADVNNDGRADVIGRTFTGSWWVAKSNGTSFVNEGWGVWPAVSWHDLLVGDLNGDGLDDIVGRADNGAWKAGISNGSSFSYENWGVWSNATTWSDVQIIDVNNDGRADIVGRAATGSWWVAKSLGHQSVNEPWGVWPAINWADVSVGDVNGDGLDDIIGRALDGSWRVGRNNGSSFVYESWGVWSSATTWSDVRVADFTGDGRDDILGRSAAGSWWLAKSTGSGFVNEPWGLWPLVNWQFVLYGNFSNAT